jgi:hypothetical protein
MPPENVGAPFNAGRLILGCFTPILTTGRE